MQVWGKTEKKNIDEKHLGIYRQAFQLRLAGTISGRELKYRRATGEKSAKHLHKHLAIRLGDCTSRELNARN